MMEMKIFSADLAVRTMRSCIFTLWSLAGKKVQPGRRCFGAGPNWFENDRVALVVSFETL